MADLKPSWDYSRFGNGQGEMRLGDVHIDGTKLAALIRNVNANKAADHFMGFASSGKLNGSTWNVCPGVYQIICGTTPVDSVSYLSYAKNGDMIIGAPNGRIRIFAKDIELVATGTSNTTGFIQLAANGGIDIKSKTNVNIEASANINVSAEKQVKLVSPGNIKIMGPGCWFEDADYLFGPIIGTQTIENYLLGLKNLIGSLGG